MKLYLLWVRTIWCLKVMLERYTGRNIWLIIYFFLNFWVFCFVLFLFFRTAPEVHGGSQTRGSVGPADAGLCRSSARSEPCLQPTNHIWQNTAHSSARSLTPLSGARNRTHVRMDTSWVWYRWTTRGTPVFLFCFFNFFDYIWFTVFCQFLLYSQVTQLYIPSFVTRYRPLCSITSD